MPNLLRKLPSVSDLLDRPPLKRLSETVSRNAVVSGVRQFLSNMRDEVQNAASEMPAPSELAERIARWILTEAKPTLRPVINATGVLLHAGLGRAPLASEAVDEIAAVVSGYASVEMNLATGEACNRVFAVDQMLRELTGGEAVAVVNNGTAATLLTLAALAAGREVIVSRGQLAEIGSYRLPEIAASAGASLREVGAINNTRAGDYASAIGPQSAALWRSQNGGFQIAGQLEETSLAELVALGQKHKLPVIDDLGAGAISDFSQYGLIDQPLAAESLKAGADVVLFSGDKLLGGPQCGIIIGRKDLIAKITAHPLMRAVQPDKVTLAALAATLRLYREPATAEQSIPLLSMLSTSVANLRNRAERLAPQMAAAPGIASADVVEGHSRLTEQSPAKEQIPSVCIALTPETGTAEELAKALRTAVPAVLGCIDAGRVILDLRTVPPREDLDLVSAVEAARKPA